MNRDKNTIFSVFSPGISINFNLFSHNMFSGCKTNYTNENDGLFAWLQTANL